MRRVLPCFKLVAVAIPAIALAFLGACGETTYDLAVDLRTDLVPGVEFDGVRLEVDGAPEPAGFNASASYSEGVRLADLRLEGGDHQVVGALTLRGETVLERSATVRLDTARGMTILLSRSCRGVDCSSSGAAREACSAGTCVDERCTPETPEFCPLTTECVNASDCAAVMCGYRTCAAGVCLRGDDGSCDMMQYCDPDQGCLDRPVVGADASVDGSTSDVREVGDAGTDASPADASDVGGADAGTDAGPTCTALDGPFGCLPVTQALRVGTGTPLATAVIGGGDWITNEFTIELWVRMFSEAGTPLFFSRRTSEVRGTLFGLLSGRLLVQLSDTPNYTSSRESLVRSGEWVHVAVTRGGDQVRFYENGVEVGRHESAVTRDITGEIPGYLGRDSTFPSNPFDGSMHHLRFWSRVLSAEEIRVVAYNRVASDAPGLLAEYTMQGSGQVLSDSTGQHDGTIGSTSAPEPDDAVREPL